MINQTLNITLLPAEDKLLKDLARKYNSKTLTDTIVMGLELLEKVAERAREGFPMIVCLNPDTGRGNPVESSFLKPIIEGPVYEKGEVVILPFKPMRD